jgi:hypothetical protein
LDSTKCNGFPVTGSQNYLPALLSGGYIGGIAMVIRWDDFVGGTDQLRSFIHTLNGLAPNGGKLNISIGMIAGVHTPCDVLNAEALYDPNTGKTTLSPGIGTRCRTRVTNA